MSARLITCDQCTTWERMSVSPAHARRIKADHDKRDHPTKEQA